jgi:cytochrome c oxidase subunit 2
MKHWHRYGRIFALFSLLMLVLAGCGDPSTSAINPQGEIAKDQASLMMLSLLIMIGVMAVVFIIFFYVIVRFRKRKDENKLPEQIEGNTKLEIAWTVIPIILLTILSVPMVYQTFAQADDNRENEEEAITVKVTANQFWWQFEYPELGITTASDLYIPTGKKVYVDLTASDVKHSFWVPALAGKQDNNPGLVNTFHFITEKEGIYKGQCAEFCGPSHALMNFNVVAVGEEEFDQWAESMKKGSAEAESETAQKGRQVFENQCLQCHATGADQPGGAGPNLAGFADRTTLAGILELNKENLTDWIKDPAEIKGGVKMPGFEEDLTEEQIDAVAEYLLSLEREE